MDYAGVGRTLDAMAASDGTQRARSHLDPAAGAQPRHSRSRPARLDGGLERHSLDVRSIGHITRAVDVTLLQRLIGNRAIGRVLGRPQVQRDVGWPTATGWNKAARTIDAKHALVRIPLAGLAKQNQQPSPNKEKTDEEAVGEAIVGLHPQLA